MSRARAVSVTYHCGVDLDHVAEVVSVRCPHCKVTPFPPFCAVPFGRKLPRGPHLRGRADASLPPALSICVTYLGFFCLGDLSLLPHLFIYSIIYLYPCGLLAIYFTLWVTIQHFWDFPGGPVVKTPCFHCRGHGFDPWLGH